MRVYQRRLPHWDVIGKRVFLTFRLHGSLPASRVFPPARMTAGEVFIAMDRILDRAENGPVYLRHPEIASIVVKSIIDGDQRFRRYGLHAFVVMPNHVHILMGESYDHLARNDEECERIKRYIEWNPVKAGLVDVPEAFSWSSGTPGGNPATGQNP